MATVTLAKAIRVFSSELGCGDSNDRESILDEITEAIEWLLFNGGGSLLREWKVTVRDGRFTLPRDLAVPIKFKLGRTATSGFGTFHSPYYSFGSQGVSTCCDYFDWETNIEVKTNKVYTQFYPPKCGVRILATTRNPSDVGKKISVAGKQRGMPIVPQHYGFKTGGEILTIYAEDDHEKRYSAWELDEITGVVKDETCDYVMLSGIDRHGTFYHLGFYHPDDEAIEFTECEIFRCSVPVSRSCDYEISILGRVNPSIRYVRDEDILPISSFEILKLLAKRSRYDESGDFNESGAIESKLRFLIKKQVAYQQEASRQLSVSLAASGATLSNI